MMVCNITQTFNISCTVMAMCHPTDFVKHPPAQFVTHICSKKKVVFSAVVHKVL